MALRMVILMGAIAASGCTSLHGAGVRLGRWTSPLFQPRCATNSVPITWQDGAESSMRVTVCGYDWMAKAPRRPHVSTPARADETAARQKFFSKANIARAVRYIRERIAGD